VPAKPSKARRQTAAFGLLPRQGLPAIKIKHVPVRRDGEGVPVRMDRHPAGVVTRYLKPTQAHFNDSNRGAIPGLIQKG